MKFSRTAVFTALWLLMGALFALPLFSQAAEPEAVVRRFGLFIGSNDGGSSRETLLYAHSDANTLAQVMFDMGGVHPGDSLILKDPEGSDLDASFDALRNLISSRSGNARRTEFVLYYSGHSDETGLLLGDEQYDYARLRNQIKNTEVDVHIAILDSCASGAFTRTKGGTKTLPFMFDESDSGTKGHAFLASSRSDEASQESDAIKASFFTYYLVAGLRGAADVTKDSKVSLNEAYNYARSETLARTESTLSGAQHALYDMNLNGSGDLVLTDLRASTSSIVFGSELEGRLFIRNNTGQLIGEVTKSGGSELALALPPGLYTITLGDEDSLQFARIVLLGSNSTQVASSEFSPIDREVNRVRGGDLTPLTAEEQIPPAADEEDDKPSSVESDRIETAAAELSDAVADEVDLMVSRIIDKMKDSLNTAKSDAEESADESRRELELLERRIFDSFDDEDFEEDFEEDYNDENQRASDNIEPASAALLPEVEDPADIFSDSNIPRFPFSVQVFPNLPYKKGIVEGVALNFIGSNYGVNGVELGLINLNSHDVNGAELGILFNITRGDVAGFQGAGLFNIAGKRESAYSGQVSSIFNINEGHSYTQVSGIFNLNEGVLRGIQGSAILNITGEDSWGVQAAGILNIAKKDFYGWQASSIFNRAQNIKGVQSGLVNVNDSVVGVQAGLVNVSKSVTGIQFGLVNVTEDLQGFPIGLINVSKNGIHDLSNWYDGDGNVFGALQLGGNNVYTIFYGGGLITDIERYLVLGAGAGFSIPMKPFYIDIDISYKNIFSVSSNDEGAENVQSESTISFAGQTYNSASLPSIRAAFGLKIWGPVGIFAGATFDMHIPGVTSTNPDYHQVDPWIMNIGKSGSIEWYPNWFVGIRI